MIAPYRITMTLADSHGSRAGELIEVQPPLIGLLEPLQNGTRVYLLVMVLYKGTLPAHAQYEVRESVEEIRKIEYAAYELAADAHNTMLQKVSKLLDRELKKEGLSIVRELSGQNANP